LLFPPKSLMASVGVDMNPRGTVPNALLGLPHHDYCQQVMNQVVTWGKYHPSHGDLLWTTIYHDGAL